MRSAAVESRRGDSVSVDNQSLLGREGAWTSLVSSSFSIMIIIISHHRHQREVLSYHGEYLSRALGHVRFVGSCVQLTQFPRGTRDAGSVLQLTLLLLTATSAQTALGVAIHERIENVYLQLRHAGASKFSQKKRDRVICYQRTIHSSNELNYCTSSKTQ